MYVRTQKRTRSILSCKEGLVEGGCYSKRVWTRLWDFAKLLKQSEKDNGKQNFEPTTQARAFNEKAFESDVGKGKATRSSIQWSWWAVVLCLSLRCLRWSWGEGNRSTKWNVGGRWAIDRSTSDSRKVFMIGAKNCSSRKCRTGVLRRRARRGWFIFDLFRARGRQLWQVLHYFN